MAIKLPSYAQEGWGTSLNNYLASLHAQVLSMQKDVDFLKGTDGSAVLRFAGSGLSDTNMHMTFTKTDASGVSTTEMITKPLLITEEIGEASTKVFGGGMYFAASLHYNTSRIEDFSDSKNVKLSFAFNELYDSKTKSLGSYNVVVKEKLQGNKIHYVVTGQPSFIIDNNQKVNLTTNWVDPDQCRLGFFNLFTLKDFTNIPLSTAIEDASDVTESYFTPAPFICTLTNGEKETYIMHPMIGLKPGHNIVSDTEAESTSPTLNLPTVYDYKLEGNNYFYDNRNLSTDEESNDTNNINPINNYNIHTVLANYDYNYLVKDKDNEDLNKLVAYKINRKAIFDGDNYDAATSLLVPNKLYIVYATHFGVYIIRETKCNVTSLINERLLGDYNITDFTIAYPEYIGTGAVEIMRFAYNDTIKKMLYHTRNYTMPYPGITTNSYVTPYDRLCLTAVTADNEVDSANNEGLYIVPELNLNGAVDATNNNFCINLMKEKSGRNLPHGMLYNAYVEEKMPIYSQKNYNKKSISLLSTYSANQKIDFEGPVLELTSDGDTPIYNYIGANSIIIGANKNIFPSSVFDRKLDTDNSYSDSEEYLSPGGWAISSSGFRLSLKNKVNALEGYLFDSNNYCINASTATAINIYGTLKTDEAKININNTTTTIDGGVVLGNITVGSDCILTFKNKPTAELGISIGSDKRIKENITPFTKNALQIINELPLYNFNYINSNRPTIGVMAQDLQKVLPQLVETKETSRYKDQLFIDESRLVYVCMKAIKELQEEIQKIKAKTGE